MPVIFVRFLLVLLDSHCWRSSSSTVRGELKKEHLSVRADLHSEEYVVGEPVFMTLRVENVSNQVRKVKLGRGDRMSIEDWSIAVGKEDQPVEWVQLRDLRPNYGAFTSVTLAPGESAEAHVALWHRYSGDAEEVQLVFPAAGTYSYRVRVLVWGADGGGMLKLRSEGKIKILPAREGSDELLAGLWDAVGYREPGVVGVGPSQFQRLEGMIETLERGGDDSPYEFFLRWLWVSTFAREGEKVLRYADDESRFPELKAKLPEMLAELKAEAARRPAGLPKVVQSDVLTAQVLSAYHDRSLQRVEQLVEQMRAEVPHTHLLRRAKSWMKHLRLAKRLPGYEWD